MTTNLLQKAIDCLKVKDISLRATNGQLSKDFEPEFYGDPLLVQFKHLVTQSHVLEVSGDDDDSCLFRVFIDLGARWLVAPAQEGSDTDKTDNESEELAKIEATFVAEYFLTDKPGKEALDAFALQNASYHVWPYWREYLMSQSVRMNLPKVTLPAIQIASNNSTNNVTSDESSKSNDAD